MSPFLSDVSRATLLGCALASTLPLARAQAPSPTPSALEPVVVTSTRSAQRADQALADITVLNRAALDAATGQTLAQLLAAQPGLQLSANGGLGKTATVSLRGLESRHVLLLIDGVRYGSATVGTPVWDNLPLEAIERIEIVRGPLSSLYGSDAVGGVVQIFTRSGVAGLRPHAVATVGSQGHRTVAAGLRGGAGAFSGALQVQRQQDDGFSATNAGVPFGSFHADRDGFEQTSVNAQAAWRFVPGWELKATALHSKGESQVDDGPGADARVALRSQVASVQVGGALSPDWRTVLRLARSKDGYDTLSSASPWIDLGEIASTQRQWAWENTVGTSLGRLLVVWERNEQTVSRPGQPFSVSTRTLTGAAVGLSGEAGAHHWQGSLRRDRNSQFGSHGTGALAYGFDVNAALRLSLSLGTSFVAPSFNQLYYPGFGNPNLQPEEGLHKELGLRWQDGPHRLQAALYQHRIRGYISAGAQPVNLPRTRVEGLSLAYAWQHAGWDLGLSLDALDPRNATTASATFDKLLPRRSREMARLHLTRALGDWTVGALLRRQGHRFDDSANTVSLNGHSVLDLRADWRLAPDWQLGLKLNNVGDRAYETVRGYNQPGRAAYLTLRYGR